MPHATQPSESHRDPSRRSTLVAGALIAAMALAGCVSVTVAPTPGADETIFGPTPPPTRVPATPEPDATDTPAPDVTARPTRRPRVTPTPEPSVPPVATPKPTKKPTPAPSVAPATPASSGWPEGAHSSKQAKKHVGETGTVCGTVVAAQYLPDRPGRPTFLNIDKPYPDQRFNVVIWGEQRRQFPLDAKPEVALVGKEICVTGEISAYVDWTQIAYADEDATDVLP